jgi:hypothetical protein
MNPMRRAVKAGIVALTATAALACQSSPTLEELPAGTDVTIEMQDGRHVTGKLVSVDPETVVVNGEKNNGKVWVTRTNIAEVQSGEQPREPELREVIVPVGAGLDVRLEAPIASDTSQVEDMVRATLAEPFVADGVTIAPAGSTLIGTVTGVRESGRVRGRAELGVRFNRLQTPAVTYDIRTAPLRWVAEGTKGEDAAKIGIGAAAGAVIGGIAGGGDGAAIGSAIGAGGGSAVVLATKGEEIRLGSGARLRVELAEPMSVMAPASGD